MAAPRPRTPPPREKTSPELQAALGRLASFPGQLSLEDILGFHRSLRLGRAELAPFWQFGDSHYRRNRVFADDFCELLLLCWRSGQRSPIHNHRGSLCGVRVLQGVATETVFEATPAGLVASRETRELAAGSLVINGHLDIHQVSNQQAGDLVTLHLYSPPLAGMELFGMEPQRGRSWLENACLEYQI